MCDLLEHEAKSLPSAAAAARPGERPIICRSARFISTTNRGEIKMTQSHNLNLEQAQLNAQWSASRNERNPIHGKNKFLQL
jgi:hypothetical protein